MHHAKYDEVKKLVRADIPVLLSGEKGSGKTTLAKQVSEGLELQFYCMSMTRQTTLGMLLGFRNVNGKYIESELYKAVKSGGVFLLDEINAGDPNVLLSLNTIENGYVSFPEGIVECHEDFRLMATANPDNFSEYTGRAKLDAATLDRFDIVEVPRDADLEQSLVDSDTYRHMKCIRKALEENNSSIVVSMRDSQRYQKRKELDLLEDFIFKLSGNSQLIMDAYEHQLSITPEIKNQNQCNSLDELVTTLETVQS